MIAGYLAVKKRMNDRNLQERCDLMNRRRDLDENFEPVVASNMKMARDIVDELVSITREPRELNSKAPRRPKIASVPRIGVKRDIEWSLNRRANGNWSLLMDRSPKLFYRSTWTTSRYNIWHPIR